MKTTVTKRFTFEACHRLPDYDGLCSELHGHSYKLEVTVGGEIETYGPHKGMIIDFKQLKRVVEENVVSRFDHSCLNTFYPNPTAETMAEDIFLTLSVNFQTIGCYVERVRLWETEDSYAEVTKERCDAIL